MSFSEMSSPTSKIKLLNDRWQQIQHQIDREKHHRHQSIEEQLNILDSKISNQKPLTHQKMQLLIEKIQKVKDDLKHIQDKKHQVDSNAEKKIRKLEQTLALQLQSEKLERTAQTETWIKQSDDKLLEVCNAMQEITSQKGQTVEHLTMKIKRKIEELEEGIEAERKRREQNTTQLTLGIEQQLNKMHSQLQTQKKNRQSTNKKIQQMIQQIQLKLESEIQEQRKIRKQTNTSLLMLLEETCIKVQKAFE